jgi:hypothetical protein
MSEERQEELRDRLELIDLNLSDMDNGSIPYDRECYHELLEEYRSITYELTEWFDCDQHVYDWYSYQGHRKGSWRLHG